ncbi:tetratricopeptide repeat protein [Lutibacter citreus]|uniref:tetratricopeptide repeat protein n=1 Tax=Lutibacter citreus TaxID=2138210 RepID=UPI000DBEA546|nr:tetratricopeptide repeat protein [Lutibacter citreus]
MRFSFFIQFFIICISLNSFSQEPNKDDLILKQALSLKFNNPDSAAYHLNEGYKLSIKKNDTLAAINFLLELSEIHSHNVNYGDAYDGYWKALLLTEQSNDSISKAKVYQGLGWLYSFYKRDDEALKYFNLSINIRKNLLKNSYYRPYLQSDYFSIMNLYRVNKKYDMAKIYLDSCYQIKDSRSLKNKSYYLEAERAILMGVEGNYKDALKLLNEAKNHFIKNDPSYLVIINALIGEVYNLTGDRDKSIHFYKESLNISNKFNRHLNYKIITYEALSDLYFKKNNLNEAFKYLKLAKLRNDEIFGSQSENNKHLLEIKDKFRLEKDKQALLINQQKIQNLENEEKVFFLKTTILSVTIIFLLLFGFIWVKHIRNKHKNEKNILTEKQKLRNQKQQEILELKNKELTESALRLIEKEEFIQSLKKKLEGQKGAMDTSVIKRMLKTIQDTPNNNWKEFEARFTNINQSFYNDLKNKFPQLSQTDQKICALVKLNLSSKDMASLLGISIESVHTSRYRLRKKLKLSRKDNLEEYINTF